MRVLLSVVILACASSAAASDHGPGEYTFKSPSGGVTFVERWVRPDYVPSDKDCSFGECAWRAVLHFADKSKPEVTLVDEPEWYAWPADYFFGPKWIIRDQKTGSGENSFFLYRIRPDGDIWRHAQSVDDAEFAAILTPLHRKRADYYHLQLTLVSWDLPAGRLHLKASATPNDHQDSLISDRAITYNLTNHIATPE